jgi:hypothetical protein
MGKSTLSRTIGNFIKIKSYRTLHFGANLNGEFKEMVVKSGRNRCQIGSFSGFYGDSERQHGTNAPLVLVFSVEV